MENVKYDDICSSLECCRHNECSKCFYQGSSDCIINLMEDAGNSIGNLKALSNRLRIANGNSYGIGYSIGYIKGVKEFSERLEKKSQPIIFCDNAIQKTRIVYYRIEETDIDNLVKEMVGDDNA